MPACLILTESSLKSHEKSIDCAEELLCVGHRASTGVKDEVLDEVFDQYIRSYYAESKVDVTISLYKYDKVAL